MNATLSIMSLVWAVMLTVVHGAVKTSQPRYRIFYGNQSCIVCTLQPTSCYQLHEGNVFFKEVPSGDVDSSYMKMHDSCGILGMVTVKPYPYRYLVSVERETVVGEWLDKMVYKVENVAFVPLDEVKGQQIDFAQITTLLGRIQQVLVSGFYYSDTADLSLSLQSIHGQGFVDIKSAPSFTSGAPTSSFSASYYPSSSSSSSSSTTTTTTTTTTTITSTVTNNMPTIAKLSNESIQEYFLTSKYMRNELIKMGLPDKLVIRSIRGHFEKRIIEYGNKKVHVAMLSCTSPKRIGTRYNVRGADMVGNVANCVRTEMAVWRHNEPESFVSYAQVRGSIPMIWREPGGRISINAQQAHHNKALSQHFANLRLLFGDGPMIVLNLLEIAGREKALSDQFEATVQQIDGGVKFLKFPFHTRVKDVNWKKGLMDVLNSAQVKDIGFLSVKHGQTKRIQKGVVRSNCLDCMDRTSHVHGAVFESILFTMLAELFGPDQLFGFFTSDFEKMAVAIKELSLNTAHTVSQHYSGSSALRTDIVYYGHGTYTGIIQDFVKSLHRFVQQYLWDDKKQGAIVSICGFDPTRDYPPDGWTVGGGSCMATAECGDASILGIVQVEPMFAYTVNITGSDLIVDLPNQPVYKISSVNLDPIHMTPNASADRKAVDVETYLTRCSLYYSPCFDITSSPVFVFNSHLLAGIDNKANNSSDASLLEKKRDSVNAFLGQVAVFDTIENVSIVLIRRSSVTVKNWTEFELIFAADCKTFSVKVLVISEHAKFVVAPEISEAYPAHEIINIGRGEKKFPFTDYNLTNDKQVFVSHCFTASKQLLINATRHIMEFMTIDSFDTLVIAWLVQSLPQGTASPMISGNQGHLTEVFTDVLSNMMSPWVQHQPQTTLTQPAIMAIVHGIRSPNGSPKKGSKQIDW